MAIPPAPDDKPAPLPWLNKEKSKTDDLSQPWKMEGITDEILVLEYLYRIADYIRCHSLLYLLGWRLYLGTALFIALVFTITIGITITRGTGISALDIGFGIIILLITTAAFYLMMSVAMLIFLPLAALLLSFFRRKPIRLVLEIAGVIQQAPARKVKWQHIHEIVEEKGDLYFVNRFLSNDGIYVPRTAFVDYDAAQRFHAAAIELWKANGDRNAVSAEACAEFEPSKLP